MRNTTRFGAILAFALVANLNALLADTKLYLLYDADYMDKYESWFTQQGVGDNSAPLVQYAVTPNDRTMAFLEIENTDPKAVKDLPKGTKKTSEIIWNDDLIRDINKGKTDLFLIWKTKNGYSFVPVAAAAIESRVGSVYSYLDRDFDFKIDTAASFQEDNLASLESNFMVMNREMLFRECYSVYKLKREAKKTCEAMTEFEFMPAFGIVQENTGLNAAEMANNQLNLYKINGQPFVEVMKARCPKATADASPTEIAAAARPVESSWEPQVVQPEQKKARPVAYNQIDETRDKEMTAGGGVRSTAWQESKPQQYSTETKPTGAVADCNLTARDGFHVVEKGDNLYRIAREYGVSVADLKNWNALPNDQISACSYLSVAGSTAQATPPKPVEHSTNLTRPISNSTKKATARPAAAKTAAADCPCKKTAAAKPATYSFDAGGGVKTAEPTTVKTSETGIHEVQPGENLTVIGKAYGLTASELAALNAIDRNTILYPNQKLKVSKNAVLENTAAAPKAVTYSTTTNPTTTQSFGKNCFHVVTEGDNLSKIARAYGYTLERVLRMNAISDPNLILQVGQKIQVNDCECEAQSAAVAAPVSTENNNGGGQAKTVSNDWTEKSAPAPTPAIYNYSNDWTPKTTVKPATLRYIHTVTDGETVTSIARFYKMDVQHLRDINTIESGEVLIVGQKIIVE